MVLSSTSWQNFNQTSSALSHSFRVIVVPVHHYSPLFDCAGHWVPPLGSVVDLHLVQLEVDVDFHSGREGHWVRFRIQWVRFRIQLGIMHKQTWINHDRGTILLRQYFGHNWYNILKIFNIKIDMLFKCFGEHISPIYLRSKHIQPVLQFLYTDNPLCGSRTEISDIWYSNI